MRAISDFTHQSAEVRNTAYQASPFPPLESVTSPTVITEQAGFYLNRRPQTMRIWASRENGPIRPLRINGRLAWPTAEIKKLCGML